jgi:molybdate transport system substrate-binding protein
LRMKRLHTTLAALMLVGASTAALADEVKVAVAANFSAPMKEIASAFEQKTHHTASISTGATGKLFTQIENGAPFEVLLSADQKTPERLEQGGTASGRFTYAIGKLVLWSADPTLVDKEGKVLGKPDAFKKIAIANPKTAPYGAAADQVLKARGVYAALQPKRVEGENIAQTYQFVVTKNAELGFVALSQVMEDKTGSSWKVPQKLYEPIRQDAVLLKKGEANPAAKALMTFLKGSESKAIIKKYGYEIK